MADRSLFSFPKKNFIFVQKTSVFLKKDKDYLHYNLESPPLLAIN